MSQPSPTSLLSEQLQYLQLPFIRAQCAEMAAEAARHHWDHLEYLRRLVEGEHLQRQHRSVQRRLKAARFPVLKTLDQFLWDWLKKINRLQVQNVFRLEFIAKNANVIFLGPTGLGKTHFATALGYTACLEGNSVLNGAYCRPKTFLLRRLRRRVSGSFFLPTRVWTFCAETLNASERNVTPNGPSIGKGETGLPDQTAGGDSPRSANQ